MSKRRQRPVNRKRGAGVTPARPPRQRDDFGALLRTGGMKPDKQMALVFGFLREKLDETNASTWSSRLKGLPLRSLASESGRLKIQWQILGSYDALSLAALKRLQSRLLAGIK